MNSRRSFLASLGALSAATVAPERLWASDAPRTPTPDATPRGLALAPDDFSFAPGLVYLQTGSLGPSPRPVIERTIAMWKEMELDPAHYAYGVHEHAMDAVRAKAAAFIGCDTDELVLTRNTTDGMNAVAQGLTLAAGDRVLATFGKLLRARMRRSDIACRTGNGGIVARTAKGKNLGHDGFVHSPLWIRISR